MGAPSDGLGLWARGLALAWVRRLHGLGTAMGTVGLLPIGGLVPVARLWLANELTGWDGVVGALGGIRVAIESTDPDADYGPRLEPREAPGLFGEVAGVAGRLRARVPAEIRLSFLPCCGVVAAGRRRVLLVGLPLLNVLSVAEIRAVLAHELAHLARGDATGSARSSRFVEGLGQALERAGPAPWSPLRLWSSACHAASTRLIGPIAIGQEARADRASATVAGGDVAASALVKVAVLQPLFREVLDRYDPTTDESTTLYGFFRDFWGRVPEGMFASMRLRLLNDRKRPADPTHPPLYDRLSAMLAYPPKADAEAFAASGSTLVGDLEALERRLQDRLFPTTVRVEPSVFHRAGS